MSKTARLDLGDLDAPLERATVSDGKPLLLDPKTIRVSRWVNRHETSFEDANFEELKAEIQSAGGNVQPIKVRPASDPVGAERYEIVFGHRRHRACLELGLKVAAVLEEVDDQVLWSQMERENRSRAPLSAWEQGLMYQRALDAGLFPSLRQLAASIGRDVGDVSKAITIANLPGDVVAAFASPHEIRFADAKPLKDAVALAPEVVAATAKELAKDGARPATKVIQALTQAAKGGVGSSNALSSPASTPGRGQRVESSNTLSDAATDGITGEGVGSSNTAAGDVPSGAEAVHRVKIAGKPVEFRAAGKSTVLEIDARLLPKERWAEVEKALRTLLK